MAGGVEDDPHLGEPAPDPPEKATEKRGGQPDDEPSANAGNVGLGGKTERRGENKRN